MEDLNSAEPDAAHQAKAPWWKVMCLTGVDYFSTLGYQPSIAFIAAGVLSPLATIILVGVTLFAALPAYANVANHSPHGQGSISMLERLLPKWRSKMLVLALLGFAAMAFIITITLSAADAAAHVVENPLLHGVITSRLWVTILLIGALGGLFLKGFKEVIGVAVVLVACYLSLNAILVCVGLYQIAAHPEVLSNWMNAVTLAHPSFVDMLVVAVIVFPRLALGLSGFETGVMVMPLVKGDDDDDPQHPKGRIRNTRKLLLTAALIMSVLLILSSIVTTLLIPADAMQQGGHADGRALAYLAHHYLGPWFGTAYDFATVAILWFAGSSAMAGLVNLVPRYLPRFGMAPEWARAVRPLVIFFSLVCFFVTWEFGADVTSQSSAYATGVLVFLTAASFAVALALWNEGWFKRLAFSVITIVFVYTTVVNIVERPDGLKVAVFFLVAIVATSLVSRVMRSTELRVNQVVLDDQAREFIQTSLDRDGVLRLLAHKPGGSAYLVKVKEMGHKHNLDIDDVIIVEVKVEDSSEFKTDVLQVKGTYKGERDHPVLKCYGQAVPNSIAALAIYIRDEFGVVPDIYFGWTEGNPLTEALRFAFFGEGETATVTREVLRSAVPEPRERPRVHVA